jgi:hypothetical protein
VGLEAAIRRAEERAFDAAVEVVVSREVDRAIRDVLNSSFASMREEIAKKTWREGLGLPVGGGPKRPLGPGHRARP